jgi:nicotinate-nucleotide pyrophosphorylase
LPCLDTWLRAWLEEDLGRGDLTAPALLGRQGRAHWLAKQPGIFCGGPLVAPLFRLLDPEMELELLVADGQPVIAGQELLRLRGQSAALVAGERTALNLAMHLSGIATATAALVQELEGFDLRLVDTRKTTPGLRLLEKYAVRCGGGGNHRLGLDDAAMLKENHIAWAGGIAAAVAAVRAAEGSLPSSTPTVPDSARTTSTSSSSPSAWSRAASSLRGSISPTSPWLAPMCTPSGWASWAWNWVRPSRMCLSSARTT